MFNFAWSEILLIALVALIVIGPKDLPIALRGLAKLIRKMRKLAHEFQAQFDEMLRESEIKDVKKHFDDIATLPQELSKEPSAHVHQDVKTPPAHPVAPIGEKTTSPQFSAADSVPGTSVSIAASEEQAFQDGRELLVGKLLANVPAQIPPNNARFILRDEERLFPPSLIPPVFLHHGGARVKPSRFFPPEGPSPSSNHAHEELRG